MRVVIMFTTLFSLPLGVPADPDFYAHWADGQAELSSYDVLQTHYGESRRGHGVLVFVTEDINRKTLIKVESPQPAGDRLHVLKLNNVLKFTTGIYDYSIMTSMFSAVDGNGVDSPFQLKKVTFSSQEWCGHVYEDLRVGADRLRGELSSYFEREGRQSYELPLPEGEFVSEDHLLIQIRELKGPFMDAGEVRAVQLLPSLWQLHSAHRPRGFVAATVTRGAAESFNLGDSTIAATPWTWEYEGVGRTVWTEGTYPHRILGWRDANGDRGDLIASIREPYWRLNQNGHEEFRRTLGIP